MSYEKVLPFTGGTGLVVGGLMISQSFLLLIAVSIVIVSAVAIRLAWRHGKKINEV